MKTSNPIFENRLRKLIREEIIRREGFEDVNPEEDKTKNNINHVNDDSDSLTDKNKALMQKLIAFYFDKYGPMIGDTGPLRPK